MIIASIRVQFLLPGCTSLKQKRFVLNSLKARLRNKFNVSVCETDYQDKWQRSEFAVVMVTNSRRGADKASQSVVSFFEKETRISILELDREII